MSQFKAAGYLLAIVCSVATSYYTFAPELQRLKHEREFKERHDQFKDTPVKDDSIIQSENMPGSPKEAIKTEIQKSWPGLSLLKGSFGGASKPNDGSSGQP